MKMTKQFAAAMLALPLIAGVMPPAPVNAEHLESARNAYRTPEEILDIRLSPLVLDPASKAEDVRAAIGEYYSWPSTPYYMPKYLDTCRDKFRDETGQIAGSDARYVIACMESKASNEAMGPQSILFAGIMGLATCGPILLIILAGLAKDEPSRNLETPKPG